jgi:oxygen-independent coproporphyrinogen-3 oxidase
MKLLLVGHTFRYAMEQLQMSLFPDEKMEYTEQPFTAEDGAISALFRGRVYATAITTIIRNGESFRVVRRSRGTDLSDRALRRLLGQCYFQAALHFLPEPPPWGAFSGVRPSKAATRCLLAGGSTAQADRLLRDEYFITPARRRLCVEAAQQTVAARALLRDGDISVYVGIPFCPTRCAYCSFVSQSVRQFHHLVEPYLEALLQEIATAGRAMATTPFRVRTLYIGGGTPTTLDETQLARLLEALQTHLDLSDCLEFTVEAGRPETLNPEKLRILRANGCNRISINPQTMNDDVLHTIGRNHTARQVLEAFDDACAAGFDHINMDLIAGLPGDNAISFADSLQQILAFSPASVTVHTLALKKAADLYHRRDLLPPVEEVRAMLSDAETTLRAAGYHPDYLYRQKYMSGSFENVGWCQPSYTGLYNIYMMEELHSILALGAGGVSKINYPGGKLERLTNPKYPLEYLQGIEAVAAAKDAFFRACTAANTKTI